MREFVRRWGLVTALGPLASGCVLEREPLVEDAGEPRAPALEASTGAGDELRGDADAGPGEVDPASLVGSPEATDLAAAPLRMPAGWDGTGVLARRSGRLPRRAPAWAKVTAEVVEREHQRFLVASGRVAGIKDAQLARSTAANRASAELARWTASETVSGGSVREVWRDARTGETFARVELPVPPGWVPGTPLRAELGRAGDP